MSNSRRLISFTDIFSSIVPAMPAEDTRNAVSSLIRSLHRGKKPFSNKRLIFKSGEFNISQRGIKKRKRQYLADIFTTLIELRWRWSLMLFVTGFLTTWFFFGLIWWIIAYSKGDIANYDDPAHSPCVIGIDGYITALLFSIETQHTIGKIGLLHTCTLLSACGSELACSVSSHYSSVIHCF